MSCDWAVVLSRSLTARLLKVLESSGRSHVAHDVSCDTWLGNKVAALWGAWQIPDGLQSQISGLRRTLCTSVIAQGVPQLDRLAFVVLRLKRPVVFKASVKWFGLGKLVELSDLHARAGKRNHKCSQSRFDLKIRRPWAELSPFNLTVKPFYTTS